MRQASEGRLHIETGPGARGEVWEDEVAELRRKVETLEKNVDGMILVARGSTALLRDVIDAVRYSAGVRKNQGHQRAS